MRSLLGAMTIVLLCSAETIAATFETSDGFSLTLPYGWVQAPPEALRNLEAAISKLSKGANRQQYDYGYQLASASSWFEYPYILVQVKKDGRVPEGQLSQYERVKSDLREGARQAEKSLGPVVSNMKQGENRYDEKDHVLWSAFTLNIQGVGDVRGLVAVKLTEFGFIQLAAYATEDTFAQYSPIFTEAVRTLAISEEYKYRPRLTDDAPTVWGINLGQVAIAALIGGLGGGVVAAMVYLKKKQNRRDA